MPAGGRLNIKMPSYQYRDSHVKDKTVSPTVLSLTWESPYLGKTVFILRRGPDSPYKDKAVLRMPIAGKRSLYWDGPWQNPHPHPPTPPSFCIDLFKCCTASFNADEIYGISSQCNIVANARNFVLGQHDSGMHWVRLCHGLWWWPFGEVFFFFFFFFFGGGGGGAVE